MALLLTASYVSHNEAAYGDKHASMLKALDELVYARYNGCSWLVYDGQATPQIPTGYIFKFGNLSNLRQPAGTVTYNAAEETPNSSSLFLQKYSPESQVIFVSNALPVTLNRQTVTVAGTSSYLGIGNQPERFERLRLVDCLVEDYTDPVAGNKTTFTFRNHWTRFGSVRIHNGNRFALTVNFQDAGGTVTVPAYGIVTARRTHQTGSFAVESSYLPITKPGDRMSYQANYSGQCAGEMATAYSILGTNNWLRYSGSLPDYDTTSRETASYVGSSPVSSHRFYDWIVHKGKVISVLWNKNTDNVTLTELNWDGLYGGFSPTGFVNIAYRTNDFMLTSNGEAILGHTNYEHDLIPVSTNLNGSEMFSIYPDPGTGFGKQFNIPVTEKWNHLQNPMLLGVVTYNTNTNYDPFYNGTTIDCPKLAFTESNVTPTMYNQLGGAFPYFQPLEGVVQIGSIYDTFLKTNGAIGRHIVLELTSSIGSFADFDQNLLINNTFNSDKIRWDTVTSYGLPRNRQRFVPFSTRKYQDRYSEVDIFGNATFVYHPQDGELSGSLDKSGSQQIMDIQPIEETDIMIDGADYTMGSSTYGMKVYFPTTNLYYTLKNIQRQGWWQANRTSLYNGITAQQKLISWRLPRLIEHLNDLVKAINNVAEVYPVEMERLYKDPLPTNCKQLPFSLGGETSWAVPANWVLGKYDTSGEFRNWCIKWGVSYASSLPDWNTLNSNIRKVWSYTTVNRSTPPAGQQVSGHALVNISVLDPAADYSIGSTAPGITYRRSNAMQAWYHRKLFGGASTPLEYVYVTKTNLASVFTALNIHMPKVPSGERYNPSFAYDAGLTKLAGTYYSDGTVGQQRYILTEPFSPNDNDGYSFYIKPTSAGTWIQRVANYTPFRLIDQTTTSKRRFYQGQTLAGATIQWLVNEVTEDADTIESHYRSARYLVPQSQSVANTLVPLLDKPAYQTLTEINSEVPFLLVCGPENAYSHTWDTIGAYTALIPETYTRETPTGSLFFKEIQLTDMPVTVAKLKAWSGQNYPVWHCQIVERNGTMRS